MTEAEGFHPDPEQLAAFDRGQLDPEEWAAVEGHVARCGRCCRRLESLPGDDALVTLLRASVGRGTLPGAGPADTPTGAEDTGNTPSTGWCGRAGRCRWRTPAPWPGRRHWGCSTPTSAAWSTATSSRATCC